MEEGPCGHVAELGVSDKDKVLVVLGRRRTTRLQHTLDTNKDAEHRQKRYQSTTHLGHLKLHPPDRLPVSNRQIGCQGRMFNDGRQRVAVLVGKPFAARRLSIEKGYRDSR